MLADAAPEPEFITGTLVVLGLGCLIFFAALVVLVVWLIRRTNQR